MKKRIHTRPIGLVMLALCLMMISTDLIVYTTWEDPKEDRPLPLNMLFLNVSRSQLIDDVPCELTQRTRMANPEKSNTSLNCTGVPETPTVFILAFHRTGSSFTQAVLASYPGAFYLFEPFHGIDSKYGSNGKDVYAYATFFNGTRVKITESFLEVLRREELHALATCDLERLPYERYLDKFPASFGDSLASFVPCARGKTIDSALECLRKVQEKCLAAPLRVIKFIRLRMPMVPELLELYPHLKFIHLVRDPRGNALSQESRVSGTPTEYATEYCKTLGEDSKMKARIFEKYPNRIYTLRYENLANYPLKYTYEMLQFINKLLNLTYSMEKYIRTIAISSSNRQCGYCVNRGNGSKQASKWRTTISEQSYEGVNRVCGDILDMFGYNPFHSIDDVRDLSIPTLINDIKTLRH